MNAKEISDATLPTVTPDDDDLMILYDVSEETTGKIPISGIAPKVAENINIINGTLTYSPTNADGISEVFAKKYGRIAQIHANIHNCNLVGSVLTEIAITNLIPLNKSWQHVSVDTYIENLSPRCFLLDNGSIQLLVNKSITTDIRIDCIFMCE